MKEELLKGLTEEQLEKARSCKTSEDFLAVAKEEGIELTEKQLEAISGGWDYAPAGTRCPRCGSTTIHINGSSEEINRRFYVCIDCSKWWWC